MPETFDSWYQEITAAHRIGTRAMWDMNQALSNAVVTLQQDKERMQAEIDDLRARLARGGARLPVYNPDKRRIVWATGLTEATVKSAIADLTTVGGVVMRGDVIYRAWAETIIKALKDRGIALYAYVRSILHAAISTGTWNVYEDAIRRLIDSNAAWLYDASGKRMFRQEKEPYYDGDTVPWMIDLAEHARITVDMVWGGNGARVRDAFTGLFIDGVPVTQIYPRSPGTADYNRDGIPDYQKEGWGGILMRQYGALTEWLQQLRWLAPEMPIIANGAWDPNTLALKPREAGQRWEYEIIPPRVTWGDWLRGAGLSGIVSEDQSWPHYRGGDPNAQGPRLSQTVDLHIRAALHAQGIGKAIWFMGRFGLIDGLAQDQRQRALNALGLILGVPIVGAEAFGGVRVGKALGPGKVRSTDQAINEDTGLNLGLTVLQRDYEGGRVTYDGTRYEGVISK